MAALEAVGFDLDYTLWDQDAFARTFFEAIAAGTGPAPGLGPRAGAAGLPRRPATG